MQKIAVAIQVWNEEEILPLTIRQLYDLPIDVLAIYDDGCTDRSMDVVETYAKNLKCPYYIKQVNPPHDEYFIGRENGEGPQTFNIWHEDLKDYEWILHLDADEIYSPMFKLFLHQLHNEDLPPFNCVYFQRYHLVKNPLTCVWKLHDDDPPCPVLNNPYHILRNDVQMRLYKTNEFYYPQLNGMDTHPHPKGKMNAVKFDDIVILHAKRLLNNVRHVRGSSNYTIDDPWLNEQNEFKEIDRSLIPDCLIEWYNEYCNLNVDTTVT